MARPRNPNRDKARELWEADKSRSLASIAAELGLPASRIRKWKYEDKWEQSDKGALRNAKKERSVSKSTEAKLVAMVEENEDLTDKQRAFCLHYVKSFNATRSYQKAYGCSYEVANAEGPKLLVNPRIRNEIKRLKTARNEAMLMDAEDVVALHWRIAFASLDDFVEWGRAEVPVMALYGPVEVENPETGEKEPLMREINDVRFRESSEVDGQIVQEVKLGRDGASIKLADRQRSLAFLERYFELNPMDRHKKAYDLAKLELEHKRSAAEADEGDLSRLLEAVKSVE
ncbi:MAG: terminase small subunit [Christensenellales bacterium]